MGEISLSDLIGQLSVGLDAVESDLLGATPYHSKRVAVLCLGIGRRLGYDEVRLFDLAGCALLHDNALTEYILSERPNRFQKLNMKTHCILGQRNCECIPFPGDIRDFILYHHENADGSGAFGRREGEYPQESGVIALADQLDVRFALQTLSPSRLEEARKFLKDGIGTRFPRRTALAALDVLDGEMLASLSDARVYDTFLREVPKVAVALTTQEIMRLSRIIARIIDYKSSFTREHTVQIANKAWMMTGIYGYDEAMRAQVYQAANLHDIGKLFIPSDILEKPGKLTDEEFVVIQSHARYTWELLRPVKGLEEITVWASNHHEKLDGSGYPFGKKAGELDFVSRLLACLDIYQAVRETRPYHPARTHCETMNILYEMAESGKIDSGICRDLDSSFIGLENGRAPAPDCLPDINHV